jgi:hypothetical protein
MDALKLAIEAIVGAAVVVGLMKTLSPKWNSRGIWSIYGPGVVGYALGCIVIRVAAAYNAREAAAYAVQVAALTASAGTDPA